MPDDKPNERKESEMIPLTQASKETGIPLVNLRRAAQRKRIGAELRETPRGPVWYAPRSEITRYAKIYRGKLINSL